MPQVCSADCMFSPVYVLPIFVVPIVCQLLNATIHSNYRYSGYLCISVTLKITPEVNLVVLILCTANSMICRWSVVPIVCCANSMLCQ